MLYGVTLLLLGVLSAAGFIIQKRPDAREHIEKIAPYQGYIGVIAALWGVFVVIKAVLNISLLAHAPLHWLTWLAIGLMLVGNGFLLGYGLAMGHVKDETARQKAQEAYQRLLPHQTRLGLVSIGLGAWGILSSLLF
jgi:hypothetical protein